MFLEEKEVVFPASSVATSFSFFGERRKKKEGLRYHEKAKKTLSLGEKTGFDTEKGPPVSCPCALWRRRRRRG